MIKIPLVISEKEEIVISMVCPLHGNIEINVKPIAGGEVITEISCPFAHPPEMNVPLSIILETKL